MNYWHKLKISFNYLDIHNSNNNFLVENNKNSLFELQMHMKRKKLDRVWRAKRRDCIRRI